MENKRTYFVIVLIIGGVGGVLVMNMGTEFHVDREYHGLLPVAFKLRNLNDCNLTISFVDDVNLSYSFDVTVGGPMLALQAYDLVFERTSYWLKYTLRASPSVDAIDLVLGTATMYSISVEDSMNVRSNITYSNGAIGRGYIWYQANGTLDLTITEDLGEPYGELQIIAGHEARFETVNLNVDLRDEFEGHFYYSGVGGDSNVIMLHNVGWYYRIDDYYSTSQSDDPPLINIGIRADVIYAWLND